MESKRCIRWWPGHQKAQGLQSSPDSKINTKSVKVNMMNISIESLSRIEDMVSEVIILRNSLYFPWQSV